ncbi:MAG TPA: hypothetical protein VJL29_04195, partial [Thermoguttaceae bacterium]|nr:hypothetical protein [Thermoguttaceae bacterium]
RVRDCATTVVGSASLVARIEGPSAATVGDQVQYTIIVENHGETTATGLLIKDRFDEGLQYAGPPSPIEKELEEIPPGQDRRVGVEFRVTRPGSLRHAVEVTGDGGASAAAEVYLNAAPSPNPPAAGNPPPAAPPVGRPAITVEKTGPVEADVGQTAEFRIVVRNTGDVPLTDVKVVDSYDPALHPFMADAGNVVRDNALVWNIGPMPIGAKSQFTIQCRCERAAAETVNRVTVTSAEVAEVADDAPVVVQAPRETQLPTQPDGAMGSGLAMSVDDLADNVDIGRTVNYEITIENKSAVIEEELVLEVDLPPGMKPLDASIRGPQGVGHAIDSQVIRFEPVGALRPGAQIRYELAMQAVTPGQTTLHARLRSRRLAIPLEGLEETTILGAR